MQEIHSRATMLAREASSREEELVAMKVVELKEELGERAEAEPWLSGCQVLSGDLSGCRAAVRHCQVPLSDQLSGAVSAVGCCRVRV